MSHFLDRRSNPKGKSTLNRQRFLERYRQNIKARLQESLRERGIRDFDQAEKVRLRQKEVSEPEFRYGDGGQRHLVHPGNQEFVEGDRIDKPLGGQGAGQGQAGDQGENGEDDFVFTLSREEFLQFFFEDLALPHLLQKRLAEQTQWQTVRAGLSPDGIPSNLHLLRSMRNALARRRMLRAGKRQTLAELEAELAALAPENTPADTPENRARRQELQLAIQELKKKIQVVPFLDDLDLRYRNLSQQPKPSIKAVMFCIMDVSGSMDARKKDLAKRFFILLYLFLQRHYEATELVFIRHHTVASVVDEKTFFYSQETGGTVVSSALTLLQQQIAAAYPPSDWNIYVAQASDGDNWPEDSPQCRQLLLSGILEQIQYFAYVEIAADRHQSLWFEYEQVAQRYAHFAMQSIYRAQDIYPVFRELFKKATS